MAGTFSFEVAREAVAAWPPFVDSCPRCDAAAGVFVPYATTTEGGQLTALYRHRECGFQWSCRWSARWDSTWVA